MHPATLARCHESAASPAWFPLLSFSKLCGGAHTVQRISRSHPQPAIAYGRPAASASAFICWYTFGVASFGMRAVPSGCAGAPGAGRGSMMRAWPACAASLRQHDLRHARVTRWLQEGKAIHLVRRAMGHSTVRVTEGYLHLVPENLRQLVEEAPAEMLIGLVHEA